MIELIKNFKNNNKTEIVSIFGRNAIGKTQLAENIKKKFKNTYSKNEYFTNLKKYFLISGENYGIIEQNDASLLPLLDCFDNIKNIEFIDTNVFLKNKYGILLNQYLFDSISYFNFSKRLLYSEILDMSLSHMDGDSEISILTKRYKEIEDKSKSLFLNINGEVLKNKNCYFFNETFMPLNVTLFPNIIFSLSLFLEIYSSINKVSFELFLHDIKNNNYSFFKIEEKFIIDKKIFPEYESIIKEMINKENIDFLIDYSIYLKKEYFRSNIEPELKKYNKIIFKNFNFINKVFMQYFPDKFKLKLIKIYNSSIGLDLYSLQVFKGMDSFSYFEFLNNIASESESALINFLSLMMSIDYEKKEKIIILSDDSFSSFDYPSISNINQIISLYLINKRPCLYLNITNSYDIFRNFNTKCNVQRENLYLAKLNKKNNLDFINWPVKKNFCSDYLQKKNNKSKNIEEDIVTIISCIPDYRRAVSLITGCSSDKYLITTRLLHYSEENNISDLENIMKEFYFLQFECVKNNKINMFEYINSKKNYFTLIEDLFFYLNNENFDLIEHRIILCLYVRLFLEKTMIKIIKLKEKDFIVDSNRPYQTIKLILKIKNMKIENQDFSDFISKVEFLNSYIPDYIHYDHNEISILFGMDKYNIINTLNEIKSLCEKLEL